MVARKGDAGKREGREKERERGVDPLKATGREEGEKERRTGRKISL